MLVMRDGHSDVYAESMRTLSDNESLFSSIESSFSRGQRPLKYTLWCICKEETHDTHAWELELPQDRVSHCS